MHWSLSCSAHLTHSIRAAADLLNLVVFVTPAGTRNEGGIEQPAYLNFDAELLSPPAGAMKVRQLTHVAVQASPCFRASLLLRTRHRFPAAVPPG